QHSAQAESGAADTQSLARRDYGTVPSRYSARAALPARLDADASLRLCSWRAGCITKGACPVRREAMRNHRPRGRHGSHGLLNQPFSPRVIKVRYVFLTTRSATALASSGFLLSIFFMPWTDRSWRARFVASVITWPSRTTRSGPMITPTYSSSS